MAGQQDTDLVLSGIRGRDGSTASVGVSPLAGGIPPDRCLEALNVDWYRAAYARKRGGTTTLSLTFGSGGPFTGDIQSLLAYQPGNALSAVELWAIDDDLLMGRLAGGATWSAPTLKDAVTATAFATAVTLNGKLFIAYASNAERLHVWDGSTVRRVGLGSVNTAPAVANQGSGSYAATLRYYRMRYLVQSGGVTIRASEASDSQAITPSGSGASVRVTKSSAVSEGETHWQVEVSLDDEVWYVLAVVAVGTTTYDDSAATTTYSQNELAPLAGAYTNFIANGYLATDGNRLLAAGNFDGSEPQNRVYYSPVIGTTSASFADEEYTPLTVAQQNFIDLSELDGDIITGLAGPFQGAMWVFKLAQMYKLVPTGDNLAPYLVVPLFKDLRVGAVSQRSIVLAVDEAGRPAMYWLSATGPYRNGVNGLEAMVDDIQDVWDTVRASVGTNSFVFHGVYHADKHQIWWWVPSSDNTNNRVLVFDTRLGQSSGGRVRGGWSVFTGDIAEAHCSVMFANTVGASMSSDLKPYIGRVDETEIHKCDTTATSDDGTTFQAYVEHPDRHLAGTRRNCTVRGAAVLGSAGSHSLRMTLTSDYGKEARTFDTSMAVAASETRKLAVFEDAAIESASAVRVRVGDAAASTATWTVDEVRLRWEPREDILP